MDHGIGRHWAIPLRIVIGLAFVHHGIPKVFSAQDHQMLQGMLGHMGVPAPTLMAWVVGLVELLGGAALVLGLFTWIASALLTIEMIVAMLLVTGHAGFDAVHVVGMTPRGPVFGLPGMELNLLYIAGLLALFIGGPGPLSIDERADRRAGRLRAPWMRRRAIA